MLTILLLRTCNMADMCGLIKLHYTFTCMLKAVPDITKTFLDIDSLLAPCWPHGL